jgi:hypothetical protein
MPYFSVAFQLEAADLAAAEALVATWTVTPGVILMPLSGTVSSAFPPTEVGGAGAVGDAMMAASPEVDSE